MRKVLFFLLLCIGLHALNLTENGELKPEAKELLSIFEIPHEQPMQEISTLLQQQWLQANKDCWEMENRFEDKKDQVLPLLQQLNFIDSFEATKENYDYALVLGATARVMQRRLDFLYEQWQKGVRFKEVVLLTGARDLDPNIEIYPEGFKTEAELLVYLFDLHPLKKCVPSTLINAPKQMLENGVLRRPTTASTITSWLATKPEAGSCLAISNQPFVGYQEAVLKSLLSHTFEVEAIGPRIMKDYSVAIYLDLFAKWLKYEQEYEFEKHSSAHLSHQTR